MMTLPMLEMFLDSLEEGVLFLDKDRNVVAANRSASQMLGYEIDQLIGRLCPSVFSGTACAKACELRGRCSLTYDTTEFKGSQDIALQRPGRAPVSLRMWAILLPPEESMPLHAAIILRDRSHEVELEQKVSERLQLGHMVGHGPAMQTLYSQILRISSSDATVLITGESGTGKELVAKALHDNSARCNKPFIPVNCAALPEHLLESELFGFSKGAFTGATNMKIGRFEAAEGGTLLLDEIGDIPPGIQVKLLRVLQEREIVRLGENHTRKVDVRVIAATHRNLALMVEQGEFREDLYYRLCVIPIHVPALRDRKEDISMIANKLLVDLSDHYKRDVTRLAHESLLALEAYDWPGNIRQLFNALEYAMVHADEGIIQPHHLPPDIKHESGPFSNPKASPLTLTRSYYRPPSGQEDELGIISRVLAETGGNKAEAARKLGMSRTSLWKKLKRNSVGS